MPNTEPSCEACKQAVGLSRAHIEEQGVTCQSCGGHLAHDGGQPQAPRRDENGQPLQELFEG